jgi:MYXO-CTERM domain-containing protein
MGVSLLTILRRCLSDFSAGVPVVSSPPEELGWPVLVPFLLLLVLALLWPWRRRNWVFLVACLSVPILAIFFVSFPTMPGWIRYFAAASPHYFFLLARGADGLRKFALSGSPTTRRRIGGAGLVALLVAPLVFSQVRSLHRYYTDPAYWRWDYRGQIATMAEDTREGAVIVFNGGPVTFLFRYYLPPNVSYEPIPSVCDKDEERVRREIAVVAAEHEQIWLVRVLPMPCDYNQRAAQWLNEHAYRVSETWLENNVFSHYLVPAEMGPFRPPAQPEPVTFGGRFELAEFALNRECVAPGDELAVALRWRVLSPMNVDYKFFLTLLGPDDEVIALQDGMPLNWLRPTTLWEAEAIEDDRWGMTVEADTPAGAYPLYVGAYDPATGERLSLQTPDGEIIGDKMLITEIEVR